VRAAGFQVLPPGGSAQLDAFRRVSKASTGKVNPLSPAEIDLVRAWLDAPAQTK
jgi:hypothetical protein